MSSYLLNNALFRNGHPIFPPDTEIQGDLESRYTPYDENGEPTLSANDVHNSGAKLKKHAGRIVWYGRHDNGYAYRIPQAYARVTDPKIILMHYEHFKTHVSQLHLRGLTTEEDQNYELFRRFATRMYQETVGLQSHPEIPNEHYENFKAFVHALWLLSQRNQVHPPQQQQALTIEE